MRRASALVLGLALSACVGGDGPSRSARATLFVGIDVSGSFQNTGHYLEALEFLSHYLYARVNGIGGLEKAKSVFVGIIGGEFEDEPKSFHPIHDLQGKTPEEIQGLLSEWYPASNKITDYNVFFRQAAHIVQKRNLALSPITVVMVTDGIPAVPGAAGKAEIGRYDKIDMSPLEYLSRKVTVRLLYPSATVAQKWEAEVPRQRVRLWTADEQAMAGWKGQFKEGAPPEAQDKLWAWIGDVVDYRVRSVKFKVKSRR